MSSAKKRRRTTKRRKSRPVPFNVYLVRISKLKKVFEGQSADDAQRFADRFYELDAANPTGWTAVVSTGRGGEGRWPQPVS